MLGAKSGRFNQLLKGLRTQPRLPQPKQSFGMKHIQCVLFQWPKGRLHIPVCMVASFVATTLLLRCTATCSTTWHPNGVKSNCRTAKLRHVPSPSVPDFTINLNSLERGITSKQVGLKQTQKVGRKMRRWLRISYPLSPHPWPFFPLLAAIPDPSLLQLHCFFHRNCLTFTTQLTLDSRNLSKIPPVLREMVVCFW